MILEPKSIATLKARAALVGVELAVIADDAEHPVFLLSRWALTRQVHSVEEVDEFLVRMGAPAA